MKFRNHPLASMMGVYERQDEREKVNGRFVYEGPDEWWAWFCGGKWFIGREIGSPECSVESSAAVPENIQTQERRVNEGCEMLLNITSLSHKPASVFNCIVTHCVNYTGLRRCGKCRHSGAFCCFIECQRAHEDLLKSRPEADGKAEVAVKESTEDFFF
jgi:hypothetical protein